MRIPRWLIHSIFNVRVDGDHQVTDAIEAWVSHAIADEEEIFEALDEELKKYAA